ncbi:hypothetical protein [Shewanella sp. SM74]|uniref:hypothetical protein n=1 Tax=Shewanella sp. SM74 TaxID=2912807 RepID=UPI0021D9F4B5|nr:hypothetical protein [Shewanella sp. SM74]MCU8011278.1 hypothetical protein [Shewanella sp. SM74]
MNKVFKASILAASVALSFGASAATVAPSSVTYLSSEGVAAGIVAENKNISFDVIVEKNHPASSIITLTFDSKLDLDDLSAGTGEVTQTPGAGTATAGDITFNYGTGSFTFDNVEIDAEKGTITFVVNLGNPLTADSAFRISLGAAKVDLTGKSIVSYKSTKADGTEIETGSGVIADTKSQFSFAITKPYSKLIDREDNKEFIDGTSAEDLEYVFTNDETLGAALEDVSAKIEFTGAFGSTLTADFDGATTTGTAVSNGVGALPGPAVKATKVTVNLADTEVPLADGTDNDGVLSFALATVGIDIPQTGAIKAKVTLDGSNNPKDAFVYKSDVNAGEWRLDAAIVNVPYLPVGYTFTPNVEISNAGATDAEVQVKAFDQYGEEYKTVTLPFKAKANTVTKVSEADLEKAFGLQPLSKKKLSTTFIIDADLNNITLVPYYKEGTSRINVLADQYKADNAR